VRRALVPQREWPCAACMPVVVALLVYDARPSIDQSPTDVALRCACLRSVSVSGTPCPGGTLLLLTCERLPLTH
jgi:hypothetical protein